MHQSRLCVLLRPCGDCVLSYPLFDGSRALLVVESQPGVSELVKTTKTIESVSQEDLLCCTRIWKKTYAENRRGKPDISMLVEITEEAVALAEMHTQTENLPTAEDSMVAETVKMGGSYCEEDGCDDE